MAFQEYNFDGLIGPTHNYAGLITSPHRGEVGFTS